MSQSAPYEMKETPSTGAATASARVGERAPFSSCTVQESFSWTKLAASVGAHALILTLLADAPMIVTRDLGVIPPLLVVEFVTEEPPEEPMAPPVKPKAPPVRREIYRKPPIAPPPAPVLQRPPEPVPSVVKIAEPPVVRVPESPPLTPPPAKIVAQRFEVPAALAHTVPRPAVRINLFSEGSSAPPTVTLPAKKVQTGGFGDPDGFAGPETRRPVSLAKLGSFDLPPGPGQGNGSGGSSGVRGTVASAGFGIGVATDGLPATNRAGRDRVRPGGFADSRPVAEPARTRPRPVESPVVPIEIVSKPKPAYTAEARRMRLEGEVILEVLFEASGQPRVVSVVKGLGHGLDEAAVHAAEQIRFNPARRDGQPIDYTATVRMVFQLA